MILTERDGKMSEGRSITRKDIARAAGVSISVVSRALNNSGYVEKEKKKRIIDIANQYGYIPNPIAMALQQKKTHQLLFFCGDLTGTYYNQMYHGMARAAEKIYYTKLPKSETSIRVVPMAEHTEECLLELKKRYIQANRMCEQVLCNKMQKVPTKSNIYDVWEKLLNFSGIEYAKVHKLRKTFATITISEGVAISDVSQVLGHRDTGITLSAYYKATGSGSDAVRRTLNTVYGSKIS